MNLQTFEITSKVIQNQVKKKFQYHLKILFLKIKIDNIRIDSEIIYMDLFIQDKTRYIFWVNVLLHLSNATYEIMVKNFFDIHVMTCSCFFQRSFVIWNLMFNTVLQCKFLNSTIQGNFLVVTAPKVRVFQLAVGQEHIQPIYQRSESYSDSFNMNTMRFRIVAILQFKQIIFHTHLVFSKDVDYKNYFAIFSFQQWELILTDRLEKREIYEVKIQAQNKLHSNNKYIYLIIHYILKQPDNTENHFRKKYQTWVTFLYNFDFLKSAFNFCFSSERICIQNQKKIKKCHNGK